MTRDTLDGSHESVVSHVKSRFSEVRIQVGRKCASSHVGSNTQFPETFCAPVAGKKFVANLSGTTTPGSSSSCGNRYKEVGEIGTGAFN